MVNYKYQGHIIINLKVSDDMSKNNANIEQRSQIVYSRNNDFDTCDEQCPFDCESPNKETGDDWQMWQEGQLTPHKLKLICGRRYQKLS